MLKLFVLLVSTAFALPVSERITENWLQRLSKRSVHARFNLILSVKNSSIRSTKLITTGHSDFIECSVGAFPVPTIHWLKDGHVIPNSQVNYINNEIPPGLMLINARLYLDEVTPEQAGLYTFVAENSRGVARKDTKVEIVASHQYEAHNSADKNYAPRIKAWTTSLLENDGNDVRILCRSDGKPTPTISWSRGNEEENVPVVVKNNSKYQIQENGDLIIKDISWEDMGVYYCESKNSLGSQKAESFLYPLSHDKE